MDFNDTLNTRNLFTDFGLVIQSGTAGLLAFPYRKSTLEVDWREQNGKTYDLSTPVFDDKQVSLKCAIMATDDTDYWSKYDDFLTELTKADTQDLYIYDHGKTYSFFYKSSSNWSKKSKRLKDVQKVFVQFTLNLQIV